MLKILKTSIICVTIFIILFFSTSIMGKELRVKNKNFQIDKFSPLDTIKQNRYNKRYKGEPLFKNSTKRSYSQTNSNHNLTEVGVWGYGGCGKVTIDGNKAYMGSGRMFMVLDISDKNNPVKLGEFMLIGHVSEINIGGGFAYVANHYGGFRIIDISDPQNLSEVGNFDTQGKCRGIDVSGSFVYITAADSGLHIIDISDPSSPTEVGSCDTPGEACSVLVNDSYAYVGDGNVGLKVIDISNPKSPTEVGSYDTEDYPRGMVIRGNNLFLCDLNGGLYVLNISDPENPQKLAQIKPQYDAYDVAIAGSYAFVANRWGPMEIYDISDPSNPQLEKIYEESELVSGYVTIHGDYIFAGTFQGLRIFDVSSPISPQTKGSYYSPDHSYGLWVSNNYAYVANYSAGLLILDVSDPENPVKAGVYNTGESEAMDVIVKGNYAYLANGWMGLVILNVSNPASPKLVSTCAPSHYGYGLAVSGNFAYLANYRSGLQIIDISNPNSPKTVGTLDTPGRAVNVFVSSNYAYVADGAAGVRVIDVTTPSAPSEVAFYDTAGFANDVFVHRNYIYVADDNNGLCIIDLPSQVGHYQVDSSVWGIYISGDYAYITTHHDGLKVLDISNPSSPREVTSIFSDSLHNLWGIYIGNGYIYTTIVWLSTLNIFKHDTTPPAISLNRDKLNFGYEVGGDSPVLQTFNISNSGGGTLNWSVTGDPNWMFCTPSSGTNSGTISVSVDPSGLSTGTYNGAITVSDPDATNSPQTVSVTLNVYNTNQTAAPFGQYTTPTDGSTVSSSIPVTGWVLDDIGVESLKIYRGSGNNLVYIGDAAFVEGARPDVEQTYPGYPMNYKAGWGYMMLTNFLPPGGNGTFKIHAIATDVEGHHVTLGTKTITVDNANAVKPFGAIDTPTQGGTASGDSFVNWGWVLTPHPNSIPTDGSTINVFVDNVNLGHPTYNIYRSDIATLFPGYANSDGAIGYFSLDTTAYENGVHTIHWTAQDNAGNTDGIGSRYFAIQNSIGNSQSLTINGRQLEAGRKQNLLKIPMDTVSPVKVLKGYKKDRAIQKISPDDKGMITIHIRELEPLEIKLTNLYEGYMIVNNLIKPLPLGSTLDSEKDSFSWIPLPGFVGNYQFVFFQKGKNNKMTRSNVVVKILPKFFNDTED